MTKIITDRFQGKGRRTLNYLLAATFALATSCAWAANINWTGGTGGTEAAPLDIYYGNNWDSSALPTTSDVLVFSVGAPTVLTNSMDNADTTAISGGVFIQSGDYTFLGGLYSTGDINVPQTGSGSITIVKKGNWKLGRAAYFGSQSGSYCAFTNVFGKIEQTAYQRWFEIGNGGTGIAENLSGDWSVAGNFSIANSANSRGELYWRGGNLVNSVNKDKNPFYVGRGSPSTAIVEKDAGDWGIDNYLVIASGKNATASFKNNGGTLTVNGSDIRFGDNSGSTTGSAYLEIGGGSVAAKLIQHGAGATPATMTFNGGAFKALAAGTVISNSNYLTVNVTSNGGTIDADGYAITIEEAIEDASGETGAMTYKGGGSVTLAATPTYTGGTTVESGTVVIVPDAATATALGAITVTGLVNSVCEVVRISGAGTFSQGDLPANTADVSFLVSPDGKSILAVNGLSGSFWIGGSGDLATATNWSDGAVPTANPLIAWASPITLTNSGSFSPNTMTISDGSAVVTLAGNLTVNTLTNAQRLAVASGALLTVADDLVSVATVENGSSVFLYNNEGTVTVGGKARGLGFDGYPHVYQYEVVTANTQPIRAKGIAYDCPGGKRLYMHLNARDNKAGKWVVGSDGMTLPHTRQAGYSKFYMQNAGSDVTLYSSADWTLANSGTKSTEDGDLKVYSGASLTIDTSDYDNPTVKRTITLNGRIQVAGSASIVGCGTVVVNTTGSASSLTEEQQNTSIASGKTLYVKDTATLQINAGKKILGAGTISLAAGTTFALDASALGAIGDTEFAPRIPGLALPSTGAATIRIDGARLSSGDHVIAIVASGTSDNVTLDPASAALANRKGSLSVEGGNLILNVTSPGLKLFVR